MVCHETYKDQKNNWLTPNEVEKINNKYVKKNNPEEEIKVGPSESMSKSKKNTIDPEIMIKNYGADAVRLFILSDSPPEKDVQWSDLGMVSAYKFVQKLFLLNEKVKIINNKEKKEISNELSKFINQYLNKIEKNLSNFHYNVIIANIHEAYTFFSQIIKNEINYSNLIDEYSKFLISITPVVPHLSSECLNQLNINEYSWPSIDERFLVEENISIVVQFNGKKRGMIDTKKDISENELVKDVLKSKTFDKFLKDNKIKKCFYVKNRLINFLI